MHAMATSQPSDDTHDWNGETEKSTVTRRLWQRLCEFARGTVEGDDESTDSAAKDAAAPSTDESNSADRDESIADALSADEPFSRERVLLETGLTPTECVERLLHEREGRMRQQDIVETTGWSAPTVSRILSEMEEEGTIVRVRIGPGKVAFLPGRSPRRVPAE